MTKEDVKVALEKIEKYAQDDNEMAHINQDYLFENFVKAIRDGKYETKDEIVEIATEVCKVIDIDFERWFA